ncbi:hypothetical protein OEZ60_09750 [Defluviimonas sp. WL0024]|uniref:Uncharacterized protein n=1 Tax=Albidovulum salinarum TaxID=2984153 RepID=A0ABT2X2W6_9RHOB|nr:hypothetical protein [Defluviimonas sp. WL0024]MCU9848291.1 hypothetical protein [Defluviimonas sp. WL0024]
MTTAVLGSGRISAGRWEAELGGSGPTPPRIEIWHRERQLDGVTVAAAARAGTWMVSVPIPVAALSDGVQTFLVQDAASGERLGQFTIIAGVAIEDDIRAELDLLRAELDLLKKAFRRHCAETAG